MDYIYIYICISIYDHIISIEATVTGLARWLNFCTCDVGRCSSLRIHMSVGFTRILFKCHFAFKPILGAEPMSGHLGVKTRATICETTSSPTTGGKEGGRLTMLSVEFVPWVSIIKTGYTAQMAIYPLVN